MMIAPWYFLFQPFSKTFKQRMPNLKPTKDKYTLLYQVVANISGHLVLALATKRLIGQHVGIGAAVVSNKISEHGQNIILSNMANSTDFGHFCGYGKFLWDGSEEITLITF
jgi:hypothetical protein